MTKKSKKQIPSEESNDRKERINTDRRKCIFALATTTGGAILGAEYSQWRYKQPIDRIGLQTPKESFFSINDLERWNKLIDVKPIPDIYDGLIFPLLQSTEVTDIKFLSTSLVWGHASLGLNKSKEALDEIHGTIKRSDKDIMIVFNSDNIEKLSEKINVNNFIDDYDSIMGRFAKGGGVGVDEYSMLLSTSKKRFYKIRFLNNPPNLKDGVVSFDGRIEVRELGHEKYKQWSEKSKLLKLLKV